MCLNSIHEEIVLAYNTYLKESEKLEQQGVKVSAVRARQALSDLKELIVLRRKEIQQIKNDL